MLQNSQLSRTFSAIVKIWEKVPEFFRNFFNYFYTFHQPHLYKRLDFFLGHWWGSAGHSRPNWVGSMDSCNSPFSRTHRQVSHPRQNSSSETSVRSSTSSASRQLRQTQDGLHHQIRRRRMAQQDYWKRKRSGSTQSSTAGLPTSPIISGALHQKSSISMNSNKKLVPCMEVKYSPDTLMILVFVVVSTFNVF